MAGRKPRSQRKRKAIRNRDGNRVGNFAVVGGLGVIAAIIVVSTVMHLVSTAMIFILVAVFGLSLVMLPAAAFSFFTAMFLFILAIALPVFPLVFSAVGVALLAAPVALGAFVLSKVSPTTFESAAQMLRSFAPILSGKRGSSKKDRPYKDIAEVGIEAGEDVAMKSFDERLRSRSLRPPSVSDWSVEDLSAELTLNGLGEYAERFVREGIDGRAALALTERDVRAELAEDLVLGERKRIMIFLKNLKATERKRA